MNFFLDHDVPDEIRRILIEDGHEVRTVSQTLHPEALDRDVFFKAQDLGAILITCNRDDFLDQAAKCPHAGLIILIRRRSRIEECGKLLRLLKAAGADGLAGNMNFA